MNEEIATENQNEPIWLITANVVKERDYGPGGSEQRNGTKHFRGGSKVYIIGAHWGMSESVTVIGHHRASGRYAQMDIRRKHLENLRMTLCYSPKVIQLVTEACFTKCNIPSKEEWEQQLSVIESWQQ